MLSTFAFRLLFGTILLSVARGLESDLDSASVSDAIQGRMTPSYRYPQIYNLLVEQGEKGLFRDSDLEKRSRLFVGKRFNDLDLEKKSRLFVGKRYIDDFDLEKKSRLFVGKRPSEEYPFDDGEEYILMSSENSSPFTGQDFKRNHLFVGKRGPLRFVGKRSAPTIRVKRNAPVEGRDQEYIHGGKDRSIDLENDDRTWKEWMGDDEDGNRSEKRARMFVGKRRGFESTDGDEKRARLFVGRRAETPAEEDSSNDLEALYPADAQLESAAKRSRLFVGKRPVVDHHQSHPSSTRFSSTSEDGEKIHTLPTDINDASRDADKRVRLFPGKRPAPGFVGKRQGQK